MAKRFVVLVAMLALMLALAVPAFAQEEEVSATGVLEEQGQKADGTTVYAITDEATGEGYYVETATGEDLGNLVGERVTAYGTVRNDGGSILTATRIEFPDAPQPGQAAVGDEFSGFGVIESLPGGYGLDTGGGPGSGLYLEGDADFAAFEGRDVYVSGTITNTTPETLDVEEVLEPAQEESVAADQYEATTGGGTTMMGGETTMMGGETTVAAETEDGGTPEEVGIDVNEDGVVSEADGEFAAQVSQEGVASTPDEGALPGTGGLIFPVAGIAGALLLAGVLIFRNGLAR